MEKSIVLLEFVNSLKYRDLWITPDTLNAIMKDSSMSHYLAYTPKSMATIGDAFISYYAVTRAYLDNPLASSAFLSSISSSFASNSHMADIYDKFNIVSYGPKLYSIKPKADAIEQLVGLVYVHDGADKARELCVILFS